LREARLVVLGPITYPGLNRLNMKPRERSKERVHGSEKFGKKEKALSRRDYIAADLHSSKGKRYGGSPKQKTRGEVKPEQSEICRWRNLSGKASEVKKRTKEKQAFRKKTGDYRRSLSVLL